MDFDRVIPTSKLTNFNYPGTRNLDPGYYLSAGIVWQEYDPADPVKVDNYAAYDVKVERINSIPFKSADDAIAALKLIDFEVFAHDVLKFQIDRMGVANHRKIRNITPVYSINNDKSDIFSRSWEQRSSILDKIKQAKDDKDARTAKAAARHMEKLEAAAGKIEVLLENDDLKLITRTVIDKSFPTCNAKLKTVTLLVTTKQLEAAMKADEAGVTHYEREYFARWGACKTFSVKPFLTDRGYAYKRFAKSSIGTDFASLLESNGIELLTEKERTRADSYVTGMTHRRLIEKAMKLIG